MSFFPIWLRTLRKTMGHTQAELAKELGKSRETVSKYEKGEREPDLDDITAIARYFGVTTDLILGLSDDVPSASHEHRQMKSIEEIFSYMKEYEIHLKDIDFLPYLKLAVKIRENGLKAEAIDEVVNSIIAVKKREIKNKKKHS